MKRTDSGKIKKAAIIFAKGAISLLFWIAVWHVASAAVNKEILLPSPYVTFEHLTELLSSPEFFKACGISLLRIMAGFLAGCVTGAVLAVVCHALPFFEILLTPMKATVKATPVASFIIIAYMWMSKSEIPGFISALIVIPIVWSNVKAGLENVDTKLLEVGKVFRFSPVKYIKYIYYPSIKPYFAASAITGIGLAWKSGIAAEVLVVTRDGIGFLLYEAKNYFESADLFAITLVIILISLIIEKAFDKWMKGRRDNRDKA